VTGQILVASTGLPKSLAGVTEVRFQMRKADDRRYTVDGVAAVTDEPNGRVEYAWSANDLSVPGEYIGQWQITHGDGKIQTTQPPNTITIRRQ
jgi:hypothetical protein